MELREGNVKGDECGDLSCDGRQLLEVLLLTFSKTLIPVS